MTSVRQKRREGIYRRMKDAKPTFATCVVLGCGHPTMAQQGTGLSKAYCRRHVEHYRRHGSYSKASYTAAELRPYREAALRWLQSQRDLPAVREAREAVVTLYMRGGKPEEAFRLTGRPPAERAGKTWARLRARQVDPSVPLSFWMAVQMRYQDDSQPDRKTRYRLVQAAKWVHRLAGGTKKRWEQHDHAACVKVVQLHKYPASRGLVLWHLGAGLARAARPLQAHLDAVRLHVAAC